MRFHSSLRRVTIELRDREGLDVRRGGASAEDAEAVSRAVSSVVSRAVVGVGSMRRLRHGPFSGVLTDGMR